MSDAASLTRAEARASAEEQVAHTLRPLLLVAAGLMAVYLVASPFTLPTEALAPVILTESLLGAAFLIARQALDPARGGTRFVHPVMALLVAGALATTLTTMAATQNLLLTTGIALIILGVGIIVLSWAWLIGMVALCVGSWAAVLIKIGLPTGWDQLALTIGACVMLSVMAHHARLRTHLRLETLRKQEARQRDELESNLRALHATSAQLRSVVSSAPVILVAVDRAGRVTLAEGKGLAARGWAGSQVVGISAAQLLLDDPAEAAGMQRALKGTASTGLTKRDGYTFETFWTPVRDENGNLGGAICVATDVTERVRAEADARKAAERESAITRLEEMDRFKTRILNTASHELNTPLTPIKVQMHLLKMNAGTLDAKSQRAVTVLDRNVDRLATLVGDIMDVAKIQGGQLKLVPAEIDLSNAVRETFGSYEDVAVAKGITLTLECEAPLPVRADARRLTQVLFNLLGNAMKFTPSGGNVRLSAHVEDGAAVVDVRDSGEGLTDEQRARLFLPFSQVHDPTKSPHGGTGLGLYISRGIAEQHGGSLTCASEGLGRGATFTLRIPLRPMTNP